MEEMREQLLSVWGIGEETADDIILYGAKKPSFVIDAYTKRLIGRMGWEIEGKSYSAYQQLFHDLPSSRRPAIQRVSRLDRLSRGTHLQEETGLRQVRAGGASVRSDSGLSSRDRDAAGFEDNVRPPIRALFRVDLRHLRSIRRRTRRTSVDEGECAETLLCSTRRTMPLQHISRADRFRPLQRQHDV